MRVALGRQPDEAGELRRDRQQRVHGAERSLAHQLEPEREAEIRNEGERMRRIDGDRRQHRKDVAEEMLLEPVALLVGELPGAEHMNAGLAEQRLEPHPALLLLVGQLGDEAIDAVELLGWRQPVLARRLDAGDDLAAQAGHAHHVEFIEIRGRDGQEAQALEQRLALIGGLLQHPLVEMQPGKLPVDEPRGSEGGKAGLRLGRLHLFLQRHLQPRETNELFRGAGKPPRGLRTIIPSNSITCVTAVAISSPRPARPRARRRKGRSPRAGG